MPLPTGDKVWIGIDPGQNGGIAVLWPALPGQQSEQPSFALANLTDHQVAELLDMNPLTCMAAIERNSGYVGGTGNPGSAMFKFGVSTGKLLGYLTAFGIPYVEVTPQRWQKGLGIAPRKRTESKLQFKRRLRHEAEKLFPGAGVTLATADALLIAEWLRKERAR